jgi:hypothetical protein
MLKIKEMLGEDAEGLDFDSVETDSEEYDVVVPTSPVYIFFFLSC